MERSNENKLINQSLNGNRKALEELLMSVQDMVFNLSLRMLGTMFYSNLSSLPDQLLFKHINAMENMDAASDIYAHMKKYASPQKAKDFLMRLLSSNSGQTAQKLNN